MPYKLINGVKHFEKQKHYDFPGCNIELTKKWDLGDKVYPVGWRMHVNAGTKAQKIAAGEAKEYTYNGPEIIQSVVKGRVVSEVDPRVDQEADPRVDQVKKGK